MTTQTITHDGVTLTVREWAKRNSLSQRTIYYRLGAGWPIEEALTTPARKRSKPTRGAILETEFYKLVCSIDGALRVFRKRIGSYVFAETDTPGVVEMFAESRRDRCPRVAQESP